MLPWLMGRWLRACELTGAVDHIPGKAVAGWMAPGKHGFGPMTALRSGLAAAPLRMGLAATRRMLALEHDLHDVPGAVDPDAWYLLAIGVDPSAQGEGLSRRLMQLGFERADAENRPVRLETNNERNLALYEHLGFELIGASDTPGLVPQWTFRRPPQNG